jgi:hypothetical protein
METGHARVVDRLGFIKLMQDDANLIDEIRPNATTIIVFEKAFEPLVSKPDDQTITVALDASRIKSRGPMAGAAGRAITRETPTCELRSHPSSG